MLLHHSTIAIPIFIAIGVIFFVAWWLTGNVFFMVTSIVSLAIGVAVYIAIKAVHPHSPH